MNEPTLQDLARKLAVLEERMNTRQAEQESAIDRLRADMANWKTDMANWKAESAKNERDNIRWVIGLAVGLWAAAVIILGFLIRLPG